MKAILQYPGRTRYHATIVSGTTWADYVITLPEAPELIAADDGTWFTDGVANEVNLATLSPTTKTRIGPDGLIIFEAELGVPSQENIDITLTVPKYALEFANAENIELS